MRTDSLSATRTHLISQITLFKSAGSTVGDTNAPDITNHFIQIGWFHRSAPKEHTKRFSSELEDLAHEYYKDGQCTCGKIGVHPHAPIVPVLLDIRQRLQLSITQLATTCLLSLWLSHITHTHHDNFQSLSWGQTRRWSGRW
jgi:hypothetical protein